MKAHDLNVIDRFLFRMIARAEHDPKHLGDAPPVLEGLEARHVRRLSMFCACWVALTLVFTAIPTPASDIGADFILFFVLLPASIVVLCSFYALSLPGGPLSNRTARLVILLFYSYLLVIAVYAEVYRWAQAKDPEALLFSDVIADAQQRRIVRQATEGFKRESETALVLNAFRYERGKRLRAETRHKRGYGGEVWKELLYERGSRLTLVSPDVGMQALPGQLRLVVQVPGQPEVIITIGGVEGCELSIECLTMPSEPAINEVTEAYLATARFSSAHYKRLLEKASCIA